MDRDVAGGSTPSCKKSTEFPCFRIFQAVHFLSNYFVNRYAPLIDNVFLGKSTKQVKQCRKNVLSIDLSSQVGPFPFGSQNRLPHPIFSLEFLQHVEVFLTSITLFFKLFSC